jgi:hypothetical protein
MTSYNRRTLGEIGGNMEAVLDIEIYDTETNSWAQAKYLVHGYDDVFWTDSLDDAIAFLKQNIKDNFA